MRLAMLLIVAACAAHSAPAPLANTGGTPPPPPPRRWGLIWVGTLDRKDIQVRTIGDDDVEIVSDVPDVEVLLDRVVVGIAPVRVHIPPGDGHHITVRVKGY